MAELTEKQKTTETGKTTEAEKGVGRKENGKTTGTE